MTATAGTAGTAGTVDPQDIARFSAIAAEWWDPTGKFRPLHRLNPLRLAYIRDTLCRRFGRDPLATEPLKGLRIVDIGCGGGLLAEPVARMGATVVGVDAAERNIRTAAAHAAETGTPVDYRATTAEALAAGGERFDAVLAMAVLEHVADGPLFGSPCACLRAPGARPSRATLARQPNPFARALPGQGRAR
ncbi:3-demethylubiquinone-9 3-O-methyltransferase, partial [Azospirillum brasilense]|nr:3-demethylubiquinone-9 3-O-methyltransferase [Azospirillum brasilense]